MRRTSRVRCAWSAKPRSCATSRIRSPRASRSAAFLARTIRRIWLTVRPVTWATWRWTERRVRPGSSPRRAAMTTGSSASSSRRSRSATKSSAVSNVGIGHCWPASRNDSLVGIGSCSVVSTIVVAATWVRNEPRRKRMPTFRLPALYGTGVIVDDGPLSSERFPNSLRMKTMSQQASAAARYVPSLVSWVRQMTSTNLETDGRSSYSKLMTDVRQPRRGRSLRNRRAARARTHEVPGLDVALALDRDRAPCLELELAAEQLVRRARDLDPPRRAVGLHSAGHVHRVAPEVVQEPLAANHAGHDGARVDPDPEL